jgi:hypothetical protein
MVAAPVATTRPVATDAADTPSRILVVLDFSGARPQAVRDALGITVMEADLLVRRAGPWVHRILPVLEAEAEAKRLRNAGLHVMGLEENVVRAALDPVMVRGGAGSEQRLVLDTSEGALNVEAADVLVVVRGPIAREYTPAPGAKRVRTATLEPGYRFHLHRLAEGRPLEIDPSMFAFTTTDRLASSFLTISGWIGALGTLVEDDTFRHQTPALGPEAPKPSELASVLGVARSPRRSGDEASAIVDNLRQFRWHSGVRAAFDRARSGQRT